MVKDYLLTLTATYIETDFTLTTSYDFKAIILPAIDDLDRPYFINITAVDKAMNTSFNVSSN